MTSENSSHTNLTSISNNLIIVLFLMDLNQFITKLLPYDIALIFFYYLHEYLVLSSLKAKCYLSTITDEQC